MRKFIGLHLFTSFLLSCNNQEKPADCSKFVTGRFILHGKISGHDCLIVRNGIEQTEYDQTKGSIAKLKIKWLEPCVYELKPLSRQESPEDTVELLQYKPSRVEIIKVANDHCVVQFKTEDLDNKVFTDTLWIEKSTRP